MKNLKIIITFIFFITATSCQQNRESKNVKNETKVSHNLDSASYIVNEKTQYKSPPKKNENALLDRWVGTFINSDDESLKSYDEIKNRIGWYELIISPQEIIYHNDNRLESEFPTAAPGGYIIDYKCDYIISGDTIKIYKKDDKGLNTPENISKSTQMPVLILFKKNDKYYGISSDIKDSENLVNSARIQNKSPYLFYKFH